MSNFSGVQKMDVSYCDNLKSFIQHGNEVSKDTRAYRLEDSILNISKKIDLEVNNYDIQQNPYYGQWDFNLDNDVYFNKYDIIGGDDGLNFAMGKDEAETQLCINQNSPIL